MIKTVPVFTDESLARAVRRCETEPPMLKFTIPLSPVTKKNHQRILKNRSTGAHFVAPSEQYERYESAAMWFIPKPTEPISTAVNVKCLFYMPTKRACDLTNLLESIDDIMVKASLLSDDNYKVIAAHDGSRVYVDKNNPRTEVYITNFAEE